VWARQNGKVLNDRWNARLKWFAKCSEHEVWIDPKSGRVFKATYGRRYGLVIADLHEQNVLTARDGALFPIDVIIGKPSPELEQALLNP